MKGFMDHDLDVLETLLNHMKELLKTAPK